MIRKIFIPLKSIFIFACILGLSSGAWAAPLLYTVSNANQLMSVDVNGHIVGNPFTATTIGVTQDSSGGSIRRIRGLAYDDSNSIMYGMTREGDLVDVNLTTGTTTLLFTLPPLALASPFGDFWGGLAFDGAGKFYTADWKGERLAEITRTSASTFSAALVGSTKLTMVGSTVIPSPFGRQVLGLDFYPASAPTTSVTTPSGVNPVPGVLYGSNRGNMNIVIVDTTTGDLTMPYPQTMDVNNPQEIAFHPDTGILYSIHDHFSTSQNATLSTYDFSTGQATELGELPFGIVEQGPCCGNGTYGWGGLAFAPATVPEPGSLLLLSTGLAGLIGLSRRRIIGVRAKKLGTDHVFNDFS